jgi:DnaK suppressor protein
MKRFRAKLEKERERLVGQLRDLGISPSSDEARTATGSVFEEGDQAQATERLDFEFAVRERVAERINRLSAAIERIDAGTYGDCQTCGKPIEKPRLAAIPEVETCLSCQEQLEANRGARTSSF